MYNKIKNIYTQIEEYLNSDESIGALKVKSEILIEECKSPYVDLKNTQNVAFELFKGIICKEDSETKIEVIDDYFLFYRVQDIKAKTLKI